MIYEVTTVRFGTLQIEAEDLFAAKKWAFTAFPKEDVTVRRKIQYKHCEACDSRPCVCPTK